MLYNKGLHIRENFIGNKRKELKGRDGNKYFIFVFLWLIGKVCT